MGSKKNEGWHSRVTNWSEEINMKDDISNYVSIWLGQFGNKEDYEDFTLVHYEHLKTSFDLD